MNNLLEQVYSSCDKTISSILSSLGVLEESNNSKNNLLFSIYLNFMNQVLNLPENKDLLDKVTSANTNVSFTDFEKIIGEGRARLKVEESVLPDVLKKSAIKVLQDYVSELEPKITPEKSEELRKIISDGI